MKIKIVHREYPAESPGMWEDSTANIYIKGPRETVRQIVEVVGKIIASAREDAKPNPNIKPPRYDVVTEGYEPICGESKNYDPPQGGSGVPR